MMLRPHRVVPKAYRDKLIQLVPPQRQLWLVRRLTQVTAARRSRTAPGEVRQVRDVDGHRVQARVVEEATPLALRQRNLDLVTRALDKAGIDGFHVRHADDLRSAIAVPRKHRVKVLKVLARATSTDGVTLRFVDSGRREVSASHRDAIAQVFHAVTDPFGHTVLGSAFACEVEFWRTVSPQEKPEADLVAPRGNQVATAVPETGETIRVPASQLSRFVPAGGPATYRTRSEFAGLGHEHITFPIDLVYTWVDGDDSDWQARKNAALREHGQAEINLVGAHSSRYASRDELRYSLRSVVSFAPWVRQIYLVTDDQVPPWLDVEHPTVRVVRHREIFGDTGQLPTFNSHAIESRLHLIPGLSEHFIYVNDDMFFGRPLLPTTFFHANGIAKFFPSPAQLDVGPATVYDAPVTAAGKNNRRHIEERFGRTITQKMRHVPYPLRRSVLEDIERHLPAEVVGTAGHQFRHPKDLSIPSSLQHYWSFFSGQAVPGSIRYTYADLAEPSTPVKLANLLARRHCDVFCLNDTDSGEVLLSEQLAMLTDFLSAYFPFRAPFELPAEVEAERARMTATARAATYLPEAAAVTGEQALTTGGVDGTTDEPEWVR
ncbi:stealth family protein [Micromonospora sp. NIE79]|uniref:Stealth family protein n=1 Tax=Micromonospora trifolii TaxID=2911208 RepID=A0ABS9N156_9ACTN|nr:stealth family protein [Micromonospora trifolii]MCG5443689.1 stealth family protein [Micromonospora trifolii]